jgi:hypothetical protein
VLAVNALPVDFHVENTAGARDQLDLNGVLTVAILQFSRQTDGLRVVVSRLTPGNFDLHAVLRFL